MENTISCPPWPRFKDNTIIVHISVQKNENEPTSYDSEQTSRQSPIHNSNYLPSSPYSLTESYITYKEQHLHITYLHSVTIRSIAFCLCFLFLSRTFESASRTTLGRIYTSRIRFYSTRKQMPSISYQSMKRECI